MERLHHTGLTVRDLDRSLAFYRDRLGMEVVMAQAKRGGYLAAIVGYPGAHVRMAHLAFPGSEHRIELFQYVEPAPAGEPGEPRSVGITHVCVLTPDLDALLARLESGGGRPFSGPVDVDTGANAGSRALYLRDPDGVVLELFEPRRET